MVKGLFIYSLFLFMFALVITTLSLSNIDIETYLPYIQLMNIGVFISAGLTIFILRKRASPNLAIWAKVILICLGLFALYFFFVSLFNMTPVSSQGKYFLVNHGNPTEEITEKEFIKIKTQNFVSTSSLWLVFCGWTSSVLYCLVKSDRQTYTEINLP